MFESRKLYFYLHALLTVVVDIYPFPPLKFQIAFSLERLRRSISMQGHAEPTLILLTYQHIQSLLRRTKISSFSHSLFKSLHPVARNALTLMEEIIFRRLTQYVSPLI